MDGTEKRRPRADATMGIGELAEAAGVSPRTLRYYEERGLLAPARTQNGYRAYRQEDARRLAHILAMRQCGLPLATIRRVVSGADADVRAVLRDHLGALQAQGRSLEKAVARTKAAIAAIERIDSMETKDAFEELKEQSVRSFEGTYGKEARELYGQEAIDAANARMMSMTRDEWEAKELLEDAVKVQLRTAMQAGDPAGEAARELARMHEKWIAVHWGAGYGEDEYLGLVRGYLKDPRFVAYYDSACGEGATEFLVKAVEAAHERSAS